MTETKAKEPAKPKPKAAPAPAVPAKSEGPTGAQKAPKGPSRVRRRRYVLVLSFLFFFVLPSSVIVYYYATIASDRYAASASFVVRGLEGGGPSDIVGSFTGFTSAGSTTSDSYVIRRYLASPDLVKELERKFQIADHYGQESIDVVSRYRADQPFEDLVNYWQRRMLTTYDSTSGIVTFEVQAFDAETTLLYAQAILEATDTLINDLSEQAQLDSVQFAIQEVERAENRLFDKQIALRQFRSASGAVNPVANAQLEAELIASLETQLADANAQLESVVTVLDPDAQIIQELQRRIQGLQTQINARRAAIGDTGEGTPSAEALAEFEGLQLEQTFAQQRYASALSSLEQARIDADRRQRYLAIFSRPLLPQDAIYPYRWRNALLSIAACFVFWAIGTLVSYAVRDHLN